jgi:hypothetical protein
MVISRRGLMKGALTVALVGVGARAATAAVALVHPGVGTVPSPTLYPVDGTAATARQRAGHRFTTLI